MDKRRYLLILILFICFQTVKAQTHTFEKTDSTINLLFENGSWKQLIATGKQAIQNNIDFPGLRINMGYAYFMTGNYKAALSEYDNVFNKDSYNQNARYYAWLCHLYLNQNSAASYDASYLDSDVLNSLQIKPFGVVSAGLETGIKFPRNYYRRNASYTRASILTRLGWKLQLDQSLSYFGQSVENIRFYFDHQLRTINTSDKEFEYYAKLNYAITENITILGAYHYLNINYRNTIYNDNIGMAGIKHTSTYFDLEGDVDFGYISYRLMQYNAGLTFYPFGNFNLYTISKLSYQHQNNSDHFIVDQHLGFKVIKNGWLESTATLGRLNNYIDEQGLYVYNSIDITKLKLGETAFYQVGKKAKLQMNYSYEKKQDNVSGVNYNQYSITAGIVWTF